MRWRLINLAALASVIVCAVSVALVVRGRFNGRVGEIYTARHMYYVSVMSGRFEITQFKRLGPSAKNVVPVASGSLVSVRLWIVALIASLGPLAWLRWRSRQQEDRGECARCGYDLRATPHRCPECGTIPATPK